MRELSIIPDGAMLVLNERIEKSERESKLNPLW